jgi:hypothetical protein
VVAWTLWALAMAVWLVIPWLDDRLRQVGRPDLTQWDLRPGVALVSAATVGAVLASRRPGHPEGWLLLARVATNLATGAAAQYLALGTAGSGRAPARHPRGGPGLPGQRRWRAAPAGLCPAVDPDRDAALAPLALVGPGHGGRTTAAGGAGDPGTGPVDPSQQVHGSPFDFLGLGGALLVVNQLALAFTTLAVAVCAGSLVARFRRARGVERQQLRWVALAAALLVVAAGVALVGLALGATEVVPWAISAWVVGLPLALGAAVLRYRLYDLDRIISRTVAYGLLTVLLGLEALTGGLLAVVDQTMQPTVASLWLRPQPPAGSAAASMARQRTSAWAPSHIVLLITVEAC